MPACIALVPCDVSWLPSLGRITSALTFWLISVSMAAICWVMSLVGFTGANVTSGYFAAWAWAFAAMAAIQPWSAAGAEKPIVTGRPGSALAPPPGAAFGAGAAAGGGAVARARRQRGAGADGEGTGEEARGGRGERTWSGGSGIVALLSSSGVSARVGGRRVRCPRAGRGSGTARRRR